jgi:1,2-diacylglycerol 3-alpha-glucosyltransferase
MWTPKVAMITPFYPPSTGGMERFVAQLTTKLRSRGVHVKVITGNHFGSNGYEEDVVHLNTRLVVIGNPVIPSLISELTSDDYDIMHAHDEHALTSNIAAFSKTLKGTPFVMHCHGSFSGGSLAWRIFVQAYMASLCSYTLSKADATVALSPSEAKYLTKYKAKNIRIVPNAVDPQELDTNADPDLFLSKYGLKNKKIALFVGRLIPLKGVMYVPSLAQRFSSTHPDLVFVIIGDGPLRQKLTQEIRAKGLKNVLVTGKVDPQTLSSAYEASNFVLVPSTAEGMPSVVLEALLFRKPVVVSDLPNIRDYFEGVCRFIQTGDSHSMAEAVRSLLEKPPSEVELEDARQMVLTRFRWTKVVDQILETYQEVSDTR